MLYLPTITQRTAALLLALCTLLAALAPMHSAQAASPLEPDAVTTTELIAVEDQGMIESIPTFIGGGAPYFVINGRPDGSSEDWNFIQFDLSAIPADATIVGAQLKLGVFSFGGPARDLEVGRADGDWEEGVTNWNTMPAVTWAGNMQTITERSEVTWPLKPLVDAWHNGAVVNNGVVVRSLENGNNAGSQARTKDGVCLDQDQNGACDYAFDLPPRLVITYSEPAFEGARPDLGDAPDSTNHHGVNNTAYAGVLGNFPTVRAGTPLGQPAGPRHDNQTGEGILGNFLSREAEADLGPDQDAPRNNILRNTVTGNIADVADNDRGDDGWRNRNIRFYNCDRQTLLVRVSKAPNATLQQMYLNVWFDGTHDGDWNDNGPCVPSSGGAAIPATEWIVQDFVVNMNAIAPGGFVDIPVNTATVLNTSEGERHWMRFMLSEAPAPQVAGRADGRGPHPDSALGSYKFGETEDVLQSPPPAGEAGTLEVKKNVITNSNPVEWLDTVTYEIRLRHNGGTQPIQAQVRDELPYPLVVYPTIDGSGVHYITVNSPTGGAAPLQAQLDFIPPSGTTPPQQIIKWRGTLQPDAEVKLTFLVRVLTLCAPGEQTQTIQNIAAARPKDGAPITDQVSFVAKCLGYDEGNIEVDLEPIDNPSDWDDLIHVPVSGTLFNKHPYSVTIGLYQKPINLNPEIQASAVTTTSKPPKPIKLGEIPLPPNGTRPFAVLLRMADESSEVISADADPLAQINYCILLDTSGDCPNAEKYPNLHGNVPVSTTVRPSDLGDAPDSTNHFAGVAMAAYPGVPANFPTVFDPALGQPQGPRHFYPRPFHLGQRVSREIEADLGPDQDPLNNIEPPANDPDNDRFDDGSRLRNLNNCQPAAADVQVAIRPATVAYFQQLGTPAYLNVWLDGNRDGDWADGFTCQDAQGQNHAVVEHILIDFPINVVGLGAGLHNLPNIATQRVPWPAQLANRPVWVRFTLSERPASKTLNFANLQYGDGRGFAQPFKVGETEDHYRYYGGNDVDVAVQLTANSQPSTQQQPGVQAAALDKLGKFEIQRFKIDVANLGATGVVSALLEFQIPEKLRGQQPVVLQAPGIPQKNISFNFDKLSMILPFIEQDNVYSVVLGWYGCITCTLTSNVTAASLDAEYTGNAKITANGDSDTSNNQSSATLRGLLSSPLMGGFMDYTDDSCMDHIVSGRAVTNRTSINLRGKAAPNQIIAILIGLVQVATVNSDANGNFSHTVTLTPGTHEISAKYANQVQSANLEIDSPRDPASGQATGKLRLLVNPALPYDPISVCFTASNGQSIFLPTFGLASQYNQAETLASSVLRLKPGETYTMSVYGNSHNPNNSYKLTLGEVAVSLTDLDGDGLFTGLVTIPSAVQAAAAQATQKLTLIVIDEDTETTFSNDVESASDGVISDRVTGQPVANASVVALAAQVNGANVAYVTLPNGTLGQPNPTGSAANGTYSFNVPNGSYRLDVLASGYQLYRTGDIAVTDGLLAQNIALSPLVNEATTQRILIAASGFSPAQVTVAPGSVVEFVNVDLADHTASGAQGDSGVLAAGGSYKVKLSVAGTFTYSDSADANSTTTITVGNPTVGGASRVYLPVVSK